MSTRPVGQVFDIGYQRYEGPRGGRAQARAAIFIDGVKAALGIGRGGRAKILPWLFLVAAIIPALVMAFVAGLIDRTGADVDLPTHSQYYGIAVFILFLFAATAGPELLCPDRRSNVINLYLIRPLTTEDYVGARWLAFLVVMLFAAWLPQFVLLTGLVLGAPEPGVYLQENWLDIPKFLGAGFAMALFLTTLGLMVAAFTTRGGYAAAFLIGLLVITTAVVGPITSESGIDLEVRKFVGLFAIADIPLQLNNIIFAEPGGEDIIISAVTREYSNLILVSWYVLWTAGPGLILLWRYRRLSA